ncbi:MAG: hypothetical protein L0H53_16200, partial [Candidatus Nitrosocosmicus sp.]|nr:hypothetical protein [Candidatus Nitrosocosmicus sp.]
IWYSIRPALFVGNYDPVSSIYLLMYCFSKPTWSIHYNQSFKFQRYESIQRLIRYLTFIEYTKLMKIILILAMNLLLIPISYYAYAGSPGDVNEVRAFIFDTKSDTNMNLTYVPGYGNLSNLDPKDFTVGSANEINNTKASVIENSDLGFGPIDPFQEYKTNSSDWNIIVGTNPDLNQSFVTNLPQQ